MNRGRWQWLFFLIISIFYLLHNDYWLWSNPSLIIGLPVSLVYHIGYCLMSSLLMILLVKFAWPSQSNVEESHPNK